jgi:hypothetical protein
MNYDTIRQAFENTEPVFLFSDDLRAVFGALGRTDPLRGEFHQLEAESQRMNRGDAEWMAEWTTRARAAMVAARRRIV